MQGNEEHSRNGIVLSLQEPLLVTVSHPTRRVLTDPIRQANPFFHVMEFVWMMSGSRDPSWISLFNSRFVEYADDNNVHEVPLIHGAYGHRWLSSFGIDQVTRATQMLKNNPETRRVVLGMWDANMDLGTNHADLPCNTHIYLRIVNGRLNMTVCNRSNDVIWGMTGANAVHMTLLQELIANHLGIPVGTYRIFTNNAHVYKDLPRVGEMLETRNPIYRVREEDPVHVPVMSKGESIHEIVTECVDLTYGDSIFNNNWLNEVAAPMRNIYLDRLIDRSTDYTERCDSIADTAWRSGCKEWLYQKAQ